MRHSLHNLSVIGVCMLNFSFPSPARDLYFLGAGSGGGLYNNRDRTIKAEDELNRIEDLDDLHIYFTHNGQFYEYGAVGGGRVGGVHVTNILPFHRACLRLSVPCSYADFAKWRMKAFVTVETFIPSGGIDGNPSKTHIKLHKGETKDSAELADHGRKRVDPCSTGRA